MLFHGIAKIMHPGSLDFIAGMLAGFGLPVLLAYGVYIGEVIAPLMVIVGFKARIGGLIMVLNMLFALLLAHTGDFFQPVGTRWLDDRVADVLPVVCACRGFSG